MKNEIKSSLNFTKKELRGVVVLSLLVFSISFFPTLKRILQRPDEFDIKPYREEIDSFIANHRLADSSREFRNSALVGNDKLFRFDPNRLPETEWARLGLSKGQVRVIKNFEAKGGRFRTKGDLRKVYSIPSDLYEKLEPYIDIPAEKTRSQPYRSTGYTMALARRPEVSVEINTADSAMLESLRGIGPVMASRIVRYRNRAGGFHSMEQLRDVYGVDSVLFKSLLNQLTLDRSAIEKININTAEFDDLKRRPFLSYRQINSIINFRKQHGPFKSAEDLGKVVTLNEQIIRKIEPYLEFAQ